MFAYSESVLSIRASEWPSMRVSVDTNVGAVVGVSQFVALPLRPGPSVGTTTILATPVAAHDAGGPDTADCWQSHD